MPLQSYIGQELELAARAHHWKAYVAGLICPFIRGRVLEVGAGLGATMRALQTACALRSTTLQPKTGGEQLLEWTCLEPDPTLATRIQSSSRIHTTIVTGMLQDIPLDTQYDTMLYIDVLEHIHDDARELADAATRLAPNGHLIILSPAHLWLFSNLDRHVGHERRYTRRMLAAITPPSLTLVHTRYFDAVGILSSVGNRLVLRQELPAAWQIAAWDRIAIPCSRIIDPLLGYRVGKSILGVWEK